MKKRKNKIYIKEIDQKYHRLDFNVAADNENMHNLSSSEMVDQIYYEYRNGVDREIDEVDDIFLHDIAKTRVADEVELTNLLFEKESAMQQL